MKKFKTKRKGNYKKLLILIMFLIIFFSLFIYLSLFKLTNSYSSFIDYIYKDLRIIKNNNSHIMHHLMGNIDFLIADYMFNNTNDELLVNDDILSIYIYNTHDTESYQSSNGYNIKANVLTASYMLNDALSKYKINSFVETMKVSNNLNKRPYNESYKVSRIFLENAVLSNNNYTYFIDIHRDSVSYKHTLCTINGVKYAKIMFVLGLDNKNYSLNEELMVNLNNYLNSHYPNISRGVYKKSGDGVDGVYNQDFHENVILVEIGGIDNTLEEVFNSTQVLSEALYHVIGDNNEKSD